MSVKHFWKMTQGKVLEGVFGIHKPTGITSAQALRDLQRHFNPSELFAPWLAAEKAKIARENHNQRQRRKHMKRGNEVKIGHGGTLDPLATGVLIVGVGKGTKELTGFLECTKTYEAVVVFGAATDTYDCAGKVLKRAPYEHITREVVEKALGQYRGKFMQLPPLYSALKMNGKPLYEYAREGKEIPREIERRPVDVLELEMTEWMEGGTHDHKIPTDEAGHAEVNVANKLWEKVAQEDKSSKTQAGSSIAEQASEAFKEKKRKLSDAQDDLVKERPISKKGKQVPPPAEDPIMSGGLSPPSESSAPSSAKPISTDTSVKGPPAARLRMTVTSGFYVRSLCHDLGAAVGSAALMTELIRTRQGVFELGKNVLEYTDLDEGEKVWGPKVEAMIDDWTTNNGRPNRSAPLEKAATNEPEQTATKGTEELMAGEGAPREVETEKIVTAESEPEKALSTPVEKAADDKVEQPKEAAVASA